MVSFWEQKELLSYDVIIVGAGISGLSTAASLKEKNAELSVLIIERGSLPTGASTKNAGFACFGSVSELAGDRAALGDDGMVQLVERRWRGLEKTINRLGEDKIGLLKKGGYELILNHETFDESQMEETNDLLYPLFQAEVFSRTDDLISKFGFRQTKGLVFNQFEAQLNTGALIKSLWQYCNQLGVQILTGTKVLSHQNADDHIEVITDQYTFSAKSLAICTNAFSNELLTEKLDISPGRGMVMLVVPKENTEISGTFHYDDGYYYFRDFHGKLVFGGGRNLAMADETTYAFGINEVISKKLILDLEEIILPGKKYKIEMQWSGIMAFGASKAPLIQQVASRTYVGVRLGGMGVALGSMVGEELADLIIRDGF